MTSYLVNFWTSNTVFLCALWDSRNILTAKVPIKAGWIEPTIYQLHTEGVEVTRGTEAATVYYISV